MSSRLASRPVARGPRTHHRPLSRPALAVLAGLLLALAIVAPALAHADLVRSNPKDKAVLETPPLKVTLTFNEALDAGKSSFKLVGADGTVGTGKLTQASAKVMALEGLALAPGAYEVRWTAGSPDGHIVRGKLSFTVAKPTPAPETPGPKPQLTAAPTADPAASTTTVEPSAAATPAPTSAPTVEPATPDPGDDAAPVATSTTDMLIPIVVGLIVVAGIGALVLRRSRTT